MVRLGSNTFVKELAIRHEVFRKAIRISGSEKRLGELSDSLPHYLRDARACTETPDSKLGEISCLGKTRPCEKVYGQLCSDCDLGDLRQFGQRGGKETIGSRVAVEDRSRKSLFGLVFVRDQIFEIHIGSCVDEDIYLHR